MTYDELIDRILENVACMLEANFGLYAVILIAYEWEREEV